MAQTIGMTPTGVSQTGAQTTNTAPLIVKPANQTKPTKSELTRVLSTLADCQMYIKEMSSRLNEYDYEWATVIDNVEYVLVQLGELQVLYNLRLKFTKKFEYWFGKDALNPIVAAVLVNGVSV